MTIFLLVLAGLSVLAIAAAFAFAATPEAKEKRAREQREQAIEAIEEFVELNRRPGFVHKFDAADLAELREHEAAIWQAAYEEGRSVGRAHGWNNGYVIGSNK